MRNINQAIPGPFIAPEDVLPGMDIQAVSVGTTVRGTVETTVGNQIIFTNGLVLYAEDGWSFTTLRAA